MSAGVITSTVGLVSRISLHITSADAVSDAFDAWLEAKTGRDKIAAQIQNAEKKFCE